MEMHRKFLGLLAGLLLGVPAWAQQWFTVSGPGVRAGGTVVEVDLDTVRIRSHGGEAVIRVTFDVLQPHGGGYGYRSFVATTQLDCVQRSIMLTSAAYYVLPAGPAQRPEAGIVRLVLDASARGAGTGERPRGNGGGMRTSANLIEKPAGGPLGRGRSSRFSL